MDSHLAQNLLILADGAQYRALTDVTHKTVYTSERATEVLQRAVDAMAGGGQVTLGRGTFTLDAAVDLVDKVWLRGSGRGTRLQVTSQSEASVGLRCTGRKGVVISDLAVTAGPDSLARTGVLIDDSGDCKVKDVFAVGFADYGIWVRNNAFLCEVRGCTLAGNGKANLYLDHLARGTYGDFVPNLVTNCIVYGGGRGIECSRAIVLNIVGCAVYQTQDVAYYVRNTSNSVLISGCRSFQIGSHAVVAEDAHEFNLSSNIFCWHTGHGVLIQDCNWGTISGNEFIDSGSYNPGGPDHQTRFPELPDDVPLYNGVELVHAQGYSVTGNTVFNWGVCPRLGVGIHEDAQSYRNTITSNNVNYYERADIVSEGRETVVGHNISHKDRPYQSGESAGTVVQSFQTELTERFIREML